MQDFKETIDKLLIKNFHRGHFIAITNIGYNNYSLDDFFINIKKRYITNKAQKKEPLYYEPPLIISQIFFIM